MNTYKKNRMWCIVAGGILLFLLSGCGNDKKIDLTEIRQTSFDQTTFKPINAEIEDGNILKLEFSWKYGTNENSREKISFNGTYVRIDVSQKDERLTQTNSPSEARMNYSVYEAQEATIRPRYELINTDDEVEVLISDKTTGRSYRHFVINLAEGTAEKTEIDDMSKALQDRLVSDGSPSEEQQIELFTNLTDFYISLKQSLESGDLNNVITLKSDNLIWSSETTLDRLNNQSFDSANFLTMFANRSAEYANAARTMDEDKLRSLEQQIDRIIETLSKNHFDGYIPESMVTENEEH